MACLVVLDCVRQIMQHSVDVGLCGAVMELLLHRVIKAT